MESQEAKGERPENKLSEDILNSDSNQTVTDTFLSAKLIWKNDKCEGTGGGVVALKIRKKYKRQVLHPYLQHIHTVPNDIEH